MDHTSIAATQDPTILPNLHVRMPQLPTSSTELSQQINDNAKNVSRPCLNRVVTCVPTSRWVPDTQATQCMAPDCRQQFTFFNRKHHCRVCGKIFCTNCCSKQLQAPSVYAAVTTDEETNKQAAAVGFGGSSSSAPPADGIAVVAAPLSPSPSPAAHPTSPAAAALSSPLHPAAAGGSPPTPAAPTTTTSTAAPPIPRASSTIVKVCRECYYDHQLAVCRRDITTAEPRRRQRGELKMVQRTRLIQICSYLPMADLFNFSLVCSDFYFITRDNAIWIWHNATRWPGKRLTGRALGALGDPNGIGNGVVATSSTSTAGYNGGASTGLANPGEIARYKPNSDDDLSYHCSYNFTQFLHYCHLLEATRCEGLSNFANSARQVLSGYVKIAVIGPENIGKTLMIQRFLNGGAAFVAPTAAAAVATAAAGTAAGDASAAGAAAAPAPTAPTSTPATIAAATAQLAASTVYPIAPAGIGSTSYRPTAGIAVSQKPVVITGGLSLESSGLTIIDVSGHKRFDKLRAMACRGAHAIVMCYSVHSKKSLIDAALQTFALEAELGPQPVIVCGIAGQGLHEVTPQEAAPSSGRGKASIQVTPTAHGASEAFSAAIQAILEKLMDGGRHSSELLGISTNPSVLDVLLDLKG